MPTITVPNAFTNGTIPDSDNVNQNVWDTLTGTGDESPAILNGELDSNNFPDMAIPSQIIRPQTKVWATAAVDPVDLPRVVFPADDDYIGAYSAAPGTAIRFWLPEDDTRYLIFAYLSAGNDLEYETNALDESYGGIGKVRIILFCDGSAVPGTGRDIPPGVTVGGSKIGYKHSRCYTFIDTDTGSKGWHTAYLGIFSDANNVRLRTRGISVIVFP